MSASQSQRRDPERIRAYNRAYNAKNRDRIKAVSKAWRDSHRDQYLAKKRAYKHGIGPEQFAEMWQSQGGRCYLCDSSLAPDMAVIDHDHRCCPRNKSCGFCRRGLACANCNSGIGMFGDDPDVMERVVRNLRAAQARTRLAEKPAQCELDLEIPQLSSSTQSSPAPHNSTE